jgi:outer membrane protein W
MRSTRTIAAALSFAFVLASGGPLPAQDLKGRELLGVRFGGLVSTGALNEEFGGGSEIELHFIHGITNRWGVDVSLSSHNFGAAKDQDKNLAYFDRTDVDLQMFSVAAGLIYYRTMGGRWRPTIEAGPGLYSVNAILSSGFYEAQKTDNHFGIYAGLGLLYRLAKTVQLNANVKYHLVFIGTDMEDTVYFYTGENSVGFFQIAVGIMVNSGS